MNPALLTPVLSWPYIGVCVVHGLGRGEGFSGSLLLFFSCLDLAMEFVVYGCDVLNKRSRAHFICAERSTCHLCMSHMDVSK